jgi:hypothetical protein
MPPTALISTLEGLRRRVRILGVLYGVGIVLASAVGLLVGTVLLDYLLNLPPVPRLVVIVAALICLGWMLSRWVVRPMLSKLGLSDVAGKLETAFPAFNERLRCTVDYVTKQTPGSQIMKERVVSEAAELAGRFNLNAAIETKPVLHSSAAALGAIAAVVLIGALLGPDYLLPALTRLVTPFSGRPWPKRVEIQMVGDLPQRVPAGRPVDIRARLVKGDGRQAIVQYDYGDGREEREIMTRGADGVYSASLDARVVSATGGNGAMTFRVESGDDATPTRTIAIVQRLAISAVQLVVTPPPYTSEPPTTLDLQGAPATVTFGSSLAMRLTFNKDLDTAHPPALIATEKQDKFPAATWDTPVGSLAVAHWTARDTAVFQVRANDADGFTNADVADYQVVVRPDQPPTVQITRPARNEECTPQAIVPLRAIAEDDYGIQGLRLVVVKLGEKQQTLATIDMIQNGKPLDGVGSTQLEASGDIRRWQIDYPWDLSKLAAGSIKPGDVVEYHLEAHDNFAFEGQSHDWVSSGRYRITLMSQEQFTALIGDLMAQVREQIIDIRNTQRSLKDQTDDLQHETAKQAQFNRPDRQQAQALVNRQTTAAAQAKQAGGKLDDLLNRMDENRSTAQDLKDVATSVRDDLNQVAEHPMKDAASQIDDAKNQTANPQDGADRQKQLTDARNNELTQASGEQQDAAQRLDQMVERMGQSGGLAQAIDQFKGILANQHAIDQNSANVGMKNLGKTPDQMDPQDRKAQNANADSQSALADKTDKAIDALNNSSKKLEKTDPSSSQAMQQAAQDGQEQNVTSQMRNSSDQERQNQQASVQQAQAQVEVGLQMMIRELEEAQRRKLEDLAKQLADMQEQIAQLVREQSGLNYHNLALQGDPVLKKTDPKVIDNLLTDTEWPKDQIPATPDLGTQTRLQEQTERNTRNVSKGAEALPDGTPIVSALNHAADRMVRAIALLRDDQAADVQRLVSAYDPPQVEALQSLKNAKQIVDEQAAKVNQQLNAQKKEALRAAYQKILEAQKKIDVDTIAIDKAPRTADGQLGHRDAVRLTQLPLEQADLADTTAKLDDDLSTLGGVVYTWANNDIVQSMRSVRGLLAMPQTNVVTQAEQTRIEDQLQAMIDSLMVKPKQSPFAQRGGGGQCKPMLPPEAELRLEKRLQEAVNKSTATINAAGAAKDAPTLVALGGRQGQLRTLLDQLLQKSSHGQMKLGPEPDPSEKLPEEASDDAVNDQELEHALLNGDGQPDPNQMQKDVDLVGQRMARSRQRLALDKDPGNTTQVIQKRILDNLDTLIEMARAEQSEMHPEPGKKNQQQASQPSPVVNATPGNSVKNGNKNQSNKSGATPAAVSVPGHDVDTTGSPTTDITETLKEWGGLSPRKRQAVTEAASEKPIEKFKEYIDEYYQALGARSTE